MASEVEKRAELELKEDDLLADTNVRREKRSRLYDRMLEMRSKERGLINVR